MTDRSGRERACAEHDGRPTDGPTVGCGPWSHLRTRGGGPFRRPGLQRTFFLFVARRTFGINAFSKFPDRLPTTGSLEIQIHGLLKRPARRARDWPGLLRIVEPYWFSSSRFRPRGLHFPEALESMEEATGTGREDALDHAADAFRVAGCSSAGGVP
jgi:hypothetical protein